MDTIKKVEQSSSFLLITGPDPFASQNSRGIRKNHAKQLSCLDFTPKQTPFRPKPKAFFKEAEDMPNSSVSSESEGSQEQKEYIELSKIEKGSSDQDHFVEHDASFDGIVADGIVAKYNASINTEIQPRLQTESKMPLQEKSPTSRMAEPKAESGHPLEVNKATKFISDLQLVLSASSKFQAKFVIGQEQINSCDLSSVEQELLLRSILLRYQTIKPFANKSQHLQRGLENFGGLKEEIERVGLKINSTTKELTEMKGDFLAVNEPIINKDPTNFKLEKVKAQGQKQDQIISKINGIEAEIGQNQKELWSVQNQIGNFERSVFEFFQDETKNAMASSQKLVQEIGNSLGQFEDQISEIKQRIQSISANEEVERGLLQKAVSCSDKIKSAQDSLKKNNHDLKFILTQNKTLTPYAIISQSTPELIQQSVSQSLKIVDLFQNFEAFKDLLASLKDIESVQIHHISQEVSNLQENLQTFETQQKQLMQKSENDLNSQIKKTSEAFQEQVSRILERLVSQEGKIEGLKQENLLCKRNSDQLTYMSLEIQRQKQALGTLESNFKSLAHTSQEPAVGNLQSNLRALERLGAVDLKRAERNFSQIEQQFMRLLKNQCIEDNKITHDLVTSLKSKSQEMTTKLDVVVQLLSEKQSQLSSLEEFFAAHPEDLERSLELKTTLASRLKETHCKISNDSGPSLKQQKKEALQSLNKMVNKFNENKSKVPDDLDPDAKASAFIHKISQNQWIQKKCFEVRDRMKEAVEGCLVVQQGLDKMGLGEVRERYLAKSQEVTECLRVYQGVANGADLVFQSVDSYVGQVRVISLQIQKIQDLGVSSDKEEDMDDKNQLKIIKRQLFDRAQYLVESTHAIQDAALSKEQIGEIIAPLNLLATQKVTMEQVLDIKRQLALIQMNQAEHEEALSTKKQEIGNLKGDLTSLKENEKNLRIEMAEANLRYLSDKIAGLEASHGKCMKKLSELHGLIGKIQSMEKEDDTTLESQIKQMNSENPMIQRDLQEIADKISGLVESRDSILDKINEQVHSKDLTGVFSDIDDLNRVTEILDQMLGNIQKLLSNKMMTFTDILNKLNFEKTQLIRDSDTLNKELESKLDNLSDAASDFEASLSTLTKTIENLKQQTLDTNPQFLASLSTFSEDMDDLKSLAPELSVKINGLKQQMNSIIEKKTGDDLEQVKFGELLGILKSFKSISQEVEETDREFQGLKARFGEIHKGVEGVAKEVTRDKELVFQQFNGVAQKIEGKEQDLQALNKRNFQEIDDLGQATQIARKEFQGETNQVDQFQQRLEDCLKNLEDLQPSVQNAQKIVEKISGDVQQISQNFEDVGFSEINQKLEEVKAHELKIDLLFDQEERISDEIDSLTEILIELTKHIQSAKSEQVLKVCEEVEVMGEQLRCNIEPLKESCQKMLKKILGDLTEADQYEHSEESVSQKIVVGLNQHNFFSMGLEQLDLVYPQVQRGLLQFKERLESDKILQSSFEQLGQFSEQISDLKGKVDLMQDKYESLHGQIEKLLRGVAKILQKFKAWTQLLENKEKVNREIHLGLSKVKQIYDSLPKKVSEMGELLQVMKDASQPDKSADFYDQRMKIDDWGNKTQQIQEAVTENKVKFTELAKLAANTFPQTNVEQIEDKILQLHQDIQDSLVAAKSLDSHFKSLDQDVGDCKIAQIIQKRLDEFNFFDQKLDRIQDELVDLKKANLTFSGSKPQADHIKKVIKEIENKISEQESQRFAHSETQLFWLEQLAQDSSVSKRDKVRRLGELKGQIEDSIVQLRYIDSLMKQINTILFHKDIDNAAKQLRNEVEKLRSRMKASDQMLKNIFQAGRELQENTSFDEEDEFITELFSGETQITKNFQANFDQISFVGSLIQKVGSSKNDELMKQAMAKIEDQSTKVAQCEIFVQNLEAEVVEWNSASKIQRRQRELSDLKQKLLQLPIGLNKDLEQLNKQLDLKRIQMQTHIENQDESQSKEVVRLVDSISECEEILFQCQNLSDQHEHCSNMFKEGSLGISKRDGQNVDGGGKKLMYRQISFSCQFKTQIKGITAQIQKMRSKIKVFRDKIKRDFLIACKEEQYEPLMDDPVDRLFATHLNKSQINLPVQRIAAGKYLFGTKQVHAKIQNGNLLIRVGGGFMGAQEFINQYGPVELAKFMKQKGLNPEGLIPQSGVAKKSFRSIEIGEFQDKMRQSLVQKISQHQKKQRQPKSPSSRGTAGQYQSDVIFQQEPRTARNTEAFSKNKLK